VDSVAGLVATVLFVLLALAGSTRSALGGLGARTVGAARRGAIVLRLLRRGCRSSAPQRRRPTAVVALERSGGGAQ
jgi:hypothetical protein